MDVGTKPSVFIVLSLGIPYYLGFLGWCMCQRKFESYRPLVSTIMRMSEHFWFVSVFMYLLVGGMLMEYRSFWPIIVIWFGITAYQVSKRWRRTQRPQI